MTTILTAAILDVCTVMWTEVIVCRKAGRKLKPTEWPEPVRGYLFVTDFDGSNNSFRRHLRVAKLMWPEGANWSRQVLGPLMDPEMLSVVRGRMVVRGLELAIDENRAHFVHEQVWLCTPLGKGPNDVVAYAPVRAPSPPSGPHTA